MPDKKFKVMTGVAAHKLSRPEAQRVADYLRRQSVDLPSGWVALHKLTIQQVVDKYKVSMVDVITEVRIEVPA